MMLNSELQTSVMLGKKLIVMVLDNRGFGCINRLQQECGGEQFNNLIASVGHIVNDASGRLRGPRPQYGRAWPRRFAASPSLRRRSSVPSRHDRTYVVVIDTDPGPTTTQGGAWWDVAVPEVSPRRQVADARAAYVEARAAQALG